MINCRSRNQGTKTETIRFDFSVMYGIASAQTQLQLDLFADWKTMHKPY
jgi:hypothetical protein